MEELKTRTENLANYIRQLADSYYRLTLIKVTQKATDITSGIMAGITSFLLFIFTLFFLTVGLAFWLGNLVDSRPAGFFMVAGLFIILMIILIAIRKRIVFPYLKKAILKKIYE